MATQGARPRNRRSLIIDAATELFYARGYDHVSMSDIADAVGIVPSALYRHFGSRQELMREVVLAGIAPTFDLLTNGVNLARDDIVGRLVEMTVSRREIGVIWRRESRHLDPVHRVRVRAEIHTIGEHLSAVVEESRPDLGPDAPEVLGWCMFGVLLSASGPHREIRRPSNPVLLKELCIDVLDANIDVSRWPDPVVEGQFGPVSRRESILAHAIRLFADEGYAHVGIEDIGAAVGIAGPSVYNHFAGKGEILEAAMLRAASQLRLLTCAAFDHGQTRAEVLLRLVSGYIEFALTFPGLAALIVTEVDHLADEPRAEVLQAVKDLVNEMARLISISDQDGLSRDDAVVRVYAAITMITDLARMPGMRRRVDLRPPLTVLSRRLLLLDAARDEL